MKYKKLSDYKYELVEPISRETGLNGYGFKNDFMELTLYGQLTLKKGYMWNGANVVPDTDTIMEGSAFHDAMYQLGRLGILPYKCKVRADEMLYNICIEKGMSQWYANWVFSGVQAMGDACWEGSEEETREYEV